MNPFAPNQEPQAAEHVRVIDRLYRGDVARNVRNTLQTMLDHYGQVVIGNVEPAAERRLTSVPVEAQTVPVVEAASETATPLVDTSSNVVSLEEARRVAGTDPVAPLDHEAAARQAVAQSWGPELERAA